MVYLFLCVFWVFLVFCFFFFFFSSRRRHTRSKRDWSSDVCSSDLEGRLAGQLLTESLLLFFLGGVAGTLFGFWLMRLIESWIPGRIRGYMINYEIGRASCRERV